MNYSFLLRSVRGTGRVQHGCTLLCFVDCPGECRRRQEKLSIQIFIAIPYTSHVRRPGWICATHRKDVLLYKPSRSPASVVAAYSVSLLHYSMSITYMSFLDRRSSFAFLFLILWNPTGRSYRTLLDVTPEFGSLHRACLRTSLAYLKLSPAVTTTVRRSRTHHDQASGTSDTFKKVSVRFSANETTYLASGNCLHGIAMQGSLAMYQACRGSPRPSLASG